MTKHNQRPCTERKTVGDWRRTTGRECREEDKRVPSEDEYKVRVEFSGKESRGRDNIGG